MRVQLENLKITAKQSEINAFLKSVNYTKATGTDSIPLQILKLVTNVLDSELCNIINHDLQNSSYLGLIKKWKCTNTLKNYRLASILNTF